MWMKLLKELWMAKAGKQEQCGCKQKEIQLKAVSNTVWVCLKAVITEKPIKDK